MEHIIVQLGLLIFACGFLALCFKLIKQSAIIAFIVVGILASALFHETIHIPEELIEVFTDIGIIMLLFMAGLEVDFESFRKRWKLVLKNGLGQIFFNTLIGILFGIFLLGLKNPASYIYFGLCLTFSSTIIVINYLKSRKEMESFHGQLILGLMVLQDITAVTALAILSSITGGGSILLSVALIIGKMAGLVLILFLLTRFVFKPLFRYIALSAELLFLVSLGLVMGFAAAAELIHFSAEITAFMLGASLSFLPYKLEIQDKVEPIKDFGIVLFFITLGFKLDFSTVSTSIIAPVVIIALFNVLGTPLLMIILGFTNRLKSRPAFMMGGIINQISEFSLILATLCFSGGLFTEEVFITITLAAILSIFISSFGHEFLPKIYKSLQKPLSILDRHSRIRKQLEAHGFVLEDHIVLIKYNELAEAFISHFSELGKRVLILDIDPTIVQYYEKNDPNVQCLYLDIFDPDTRDIAAFEKASLIVSCLIEGQSAELGILTWLKDQKLNIPFVATTNSRKEAKELYKAGAAYVMQTEDMAANLLSTLLKEVATEYEDFYDYGKYHQEILEEKMKTKIGRDV